MKDISKSIHERRGEASLTWWNKAMDLRGAAASISYVLQNKAIFPKEEYDLPSWYDFDAATPLVFAMNAGLSLELLLKAIWIEGFEDNFREMRYNHNLVDWAKKTKLWERLNQDQQVILELLTPCIKWLAKYPAVRTDDEYFATHDLFRKQYKPSPKASKSTLAIQVFDKNRSINWKNYNSIWQIADKYYQELRELNY